MTDNATKAQDGKTFRLRGLRTIAGYAIAPTLSNDRINSAWDERLRKQRAADQANTDGGDTGQVPDFQAECA